MGLDRTRRRVGSMRVGVVEGAWVGIRRVRLAHKCCSLACAIMAGNRRTLTSLRNRDMLGLHREAMTMQRTPAAVEAVRKPPSCLSGFTSVAFPVQDDGLDLAVDFALTCTPCGANGFQILAFPKVVPDPSPYSAIEPGQTLFRPPHRLKCTSCGHVHDLFDIRTQGYDGILNGGGSYESGTDGESPIPGSFSVVVSVCYNVELDELSELAEEAGVNPSDLFDWLTISGTSFSGGENVELSYECA